MLAIVLTQKKQTSFYSSRQKLKPICAFVSAAMAMYGPVMGAEFPAHESLKVAQIEFNSDFLAPSSGQKLDISHFQQGNTVLPGLYSVDVFVNENWTGRTQILFKLQPHVSDAQPCFNKKLLENAGISIAKLAPAVINVLAVEGACMSLGDAVNGASNNFDFGEQRLNLSVPQVSMSRNARGYVSPEYWDAGVTAGTLGYDFNTYRFGGNSTQTQHYLGLNVGFNITDWRIRHIGSYSSGSTSGSRYQSIQTFANRDLIAWQSQLMIGDAYTSGDLFDSTAFRGISVATDDRMLPDSMRGYAPTVRGVANTNAKVTIKQNGLIIHETTVAPGAFEINDLYATGYGGDLIVTVQEADGRTASFIVPFAAVPMSLRPGTNRFSATAGQLRDARLSSKPGFVQGTWQRGFTNMLTGYAGATVTAGYGAVLLGGALNTPIGAVGIDVTQSQTNVSGQGNFSGSSTRISYSKMIDQTKTNFAIAAYRYSTGGFFSLNEAMLARDGAQHNMGYDQILRQRNRAQILLSQQIGDARGQLFLTGSTSDYWNRSGSDVNYSIGYSNTFKNLGYSVTVNRQRNTIGTMNTVYYASISIPLGDIRPLTLSSNITRDSAGRTSTQATLSGGVFEDSSLSYGVTTSYANGGVGIKTSSGSANMQYHSSYADFSANVGAGSGYTQSGFGMRGAVVAHPGGVTLSQPISETIGIVEAKDAADARVINVSGLHMDGRGYAVVPYLTPYNLNAVELDPKGLSTDVELQTTSQQTAPRAGAVVMLKFPTVMGRSAVIHALQKNDAPLPFGAPVFDESGNQIGTVGQASRIFARGLQAQGVLAVKWGDDTASSCQIAYDLPQREKNDKSDNYQRIDAACGAIQ